jgi:hypothetical protein
MMMMATEVRKEPVRGVCHHCGAPSAPNLLWNCATCADFLHAAYLDRVRTLPVQNPEKVRLAQLINQKYERLLDERSYLDSLEQEDIRREVLWQGMLGELRNLKLELDEMEQKRACEPRA